MYDLQTLARQLVEKPRGILAMDESLGTIRERLQAVGLESTKKIEELTEKC